MVEKSLIPFDLGFNPLERSTKPAQNPVQQKDLLDIINMYGVELNNKEVARRVSEVAGDAILRALGEKGQSSLNPKDKLKPLFRRGLEIREDLRTRAKAYLNLSIYNQNTYSDLVGPLALPTSLINAANANQRVFALTADLTPIQQVVEMGAQRLSLIDTWANLGLAALPETSKKASLDQFPEVAERVKIIRNMITSFIFRGNLSPLISVAELKDFTEKAASFFSEEAKEALLEQLHTESPQEKSYLEALYAQTREPFRLYTEFPKGNDPKSIETFYRRYTRELLLMHPALEEQQIITNPTKLSPGILNLWDGARVIGDSRIPESDLLSQALRQAQAKHDTYTAETLKAGINIWIWFEGAKKAHTAKIKSAEENLAERTQLYSDSLNPDFPLPKEAYFIRYTTQHIARVNAHLKQQESERLGEIIRDMVARQKEAVRYEQELNNQYGDRENWPDCVSMPRSVFLETFQKEKKILFSKHRVLQRQISALEELMAIDFFWSKQDKFPPGVLRKDRNKAKTGVTKELELTKQLLSQPDQGENLFSEEAFSTKQLRDHLAPYFRKKRPLGLPESLKPFREFWLDIYQKKLDLRKVLPKIPELRLELLQFALSVLEEKDELIRKRKANQIKLEETADHRNTLPKEASWSKSEARSYIKEIQISQLPSLKGMTLDELVKNSTQMRFFIDSIAPSVLPDRIMSPETTEKWIKAQMETIYDKGTGKKLLLLGQFKKMLDYLQNPLVPISAEASGIDKQAFLRAWKRRLDLVYAICFRSRIRKQSLDTALIYETLMRTTFQETLNRELQSKERELDKLRSRKLEEELLGKMRTHNLVLENPGSAN